MRTYSVMILMVGGGGAFPGMPGTGDELEQHIVQGEDADTIRGQMVVDALSRHSNRSLKTIQVNDITEVLSNSGWVFAPDVRKTLSMIEGIDDA